AGQYNNQRWQDAPHPSLIEPQHSKSAEFVLSKDYRANEIARDDEENVYADISASKSRDSRMIGDHRNNSERAQAVNVFAVLHTLIVKLPCGLRSCVRVA